MKLSDYKNEEALLVLADIVDPIAEIAQDKELFEKIKETYMSKGPLFSLVKPILQTHTKAIIAILAALDRKTPEEYEVSLFTLPQKLLELLDDPEAMSLFQ